MDLRPSPRQQALMDRAYKLAVERFAPRAATYDREASFPIVELDSYVRSFGRFAISGYVLSSLSSNVASETCSR